MRKGLSKNIIKHRVQAWLEEVVWESNPFAKPGTLIEPLSRAEDEAKALPNYFTPAVIRPGWPHTAEGTGGGYGFDDLLRERHSVLFARTGEGKTATRLMAADALAESGLVIPYLDVTLSPRSVQEHAQEIHRCMERYLSSESSASDQQETAAPVAERGARSRSELHQILSRLGEEELRTLCFNLDLEYDDLPARGAVHKARELILYFVRREQLPRLIDAVDAFLASSVLSQEETGALAKLAEICRGCRQPVFVLVDDVELNLGARFDAAGIEQAIEHLLDPKILGIRNLWFKLFLPTSVASNLSRYYALQSGAEPFSILTIRWAERPLRELLNTRVSQVSTMMDLEELSVDENGFPFDLAGELIRIAQTRSGTPRTLIWLANEMICTHARGQPDAKQTLLTKQDIEQTRLNYARQLPESFH